MQQLLHKHMSLISNASVVLTPFCLNLPIPNPNTGNACWKPFATLLSRQGIE
jgi:hypothetical protein